MIDRCALCLAHRVDHNRQTLVPSRHEVRASRVAEVMAYLVNLVERKVRGEVFYLIEQGFPGEYFVE